ncbi:hypothetical protein TPHA_0A03790 [Tetrapisispora phaffii CBS 4417]|uniref:Mitotic spindle-associated protein SHE1 n=1 Tax=Tetrapisispora phaffii (strain ATCC 24235 / CBS 4417 / NBRC 1672 / NRRL Y-8282 / UCD 70-5) TaxID=1071381 RepID=G8BNH7_TETPH|nr:hypothetical protein TPHA_0A03790 [Tetrapisispora phaffii CBS 4417]CCE61455.1 hypothetical protein TPHA_0A03790 [Tetrapisispora phaffii CBS 4417]
MNGQVENYRTSGNANFTYGGEVLCDMENDITSKSFSLSPLKTQDIVNSIGVSRRIVNSVMDELESRVNNNADTNEHDNIMDNKSMEFPVTPKKLRLSPIKDLDLTIKRLKANDSASVPMPAPPTSSPAVNDITRRIRRLRLKAAMVNTSSHNTNIKNLNNSESVINKKLSNQQPLKTPNFLKSTINSSNKRIMNTVKQNTSSNRTPTLFNSNNTNEFGRSSSRMDVRVNNTSKVIPTPSKPSNNAHSVNNTNKSASIKSQVTRSSSTQVFDRLYHQSSVSRSISMNNVAVENGNCKPPGTKRSMTRSKTSNMLSSHISESTNKPAWR